MNIEKYNLKTLLLAAIKSEIDSKELYETLAERVKNSLLKDRLLFLAGEELVVPEKTPVPLPVVDASEDRLLSEIIEDAMKAELAARDFYESMKDLLHDKKNRNMLQILANMEQGHYDILAKELENLKQFENYDTPWYEYSGL